jgi:hypothetical protein
MYISAINERKNVTSVTLSVCYTIFKMARVNRGSAKSLSITHPVLTGESRSDWALWQLSSILAEIAEQAIRSKNDGGASTEKQTRQKTSSGQVFSLIENAGDV